VLGFILFSEQQVLSLPFSKDHSDLALDYCGELSQLSPGSLLNCEPTSCIFLYDNGELLFLAVTEPLLPKVHHPLPLNTKSGLVFLEEEVHFLLSFQVGLVSNHFKVGVSSSGSCDSSGRGGLVLALLLQTGLEKNPFILDFIFRIEIRRVESSELLVIVSRSEVLFSFLAEFSAELLATCRKEEDLPFEPLYHVEGHVVEQFRQPGFSL